MNVKNREELAKLAELYKTGKITKYALEAELSKSFSSAMEPSMVSVSMVTEQDGNTNSTFGVTLLPEMIADKVQVTLLVDQEMVISLVKSAELISILENELSGFQKAIKELTSFHKERKGAEVSISDALLVFVRIYRDSLKRLSEGLPETFNRLFDSRTIQSVESIDSEIKALENGSDDPRFVVERLTISKKLPQLMAVAASKLAEEMGKDLGKTVKIPLFYTDDAPVMNQFYQQRRALVDGTYTDNKMSKVIAHDYKPETNQ
jgi:hypothetical protein